MKSFPKKTPLTSSKLNNVFANGDFWISLVLFLSKYYEQKLVKLSY